MISLIRKYAARFALVVALTAGAVSVDGFAQLKSERGEADVQETTVPPNLPQVQDRRHGKAYRQQPPLIPHRIDRYEIDLKVNQCVRCHDWPGNVEENAPKMSETHYVNRNGVALEHVARTRWFCTQCHVPQTDAPALVGNTFTPLRRGQ